MVKNTFGGNKHKSQARKFVNSKPNNKLRLAEYDGEIYAVVTKVLGNNMFHAQCIDGKLRLGHIRGKFSGRGRRDNTIAPGVWVLVGERNFGNIDDSKYLNNEANKISDKLEKCDLLEVYNESNKQSLKDSVAMNWSKLNFDDGSKSHNETMNDSIIFEDENAEELNNILENMDKSIKISMNNKNKDEEENNDELLVEFNDI